MGDTLCRSHAKDNVFVVVVYSRCYALRSTFLVLKVSCSSKYKLFARTQASTHARTHAHSQLHTHGRQFIPLDVFVWYNRIITLPCISYRGRSPT